MDYVKILLFRELSVFVASFPEYTRPMIDHLLEQKVSHWDEYVRELTGDALRNLSATDPDYVANTVIPKLMGITNGYELFACHGAVIAMGRAAAALQDRLSPAIITQLLDLPRRISESQFFKGLGGELMRKALNDLIFNLSQFISNRVQEIDTKQRYADAYRAILDDNLTHQNEDIRLGARKATEALFAAAPPSKPEVIDSYIKRADKALYEKERMGSCFALAALPRDVLLVNRKKILDVLIRFSILAEDKRAADALWALGRRDSLSSLARVIEKLGVNEPDGLSSEELESVIDCYTKALDDYTTDSRGDIGSYVREAAVMGLKALFDQILSSTDRVGLNADLSKRAVQKVLQQCCEKIDRTRELACDSMKYLIKKAASVDRLTSILHFPRADILADVFVGEEIDWTKANQAYPRLVNLLNAGEEYAYPVLLGFAVTVGGLTESTVRASSDALLAYVAGLQKDHGALRPIVSTLVSIIGDYRKVDRITLPVMKMIDQIFTSNYLDDFLQTEEDGTMLEKLLDLCVAETRLSRNSHKVLNGLAVCHCFLRYEGSVVAMKALKHAIATLTHTYPGVRREAANRLYESVLSCFSLDNHSEQALTVLSETDWGADPTNLKECQKELELLLKVI